MQSLPLSPVRKTGMERKNPVIAQTRVREAFFRYLLVLGGRKKGRERERERERQAINKP